MMNQARHFMKFCPVSVLRAHRSFPRALALPVGNRPSSKSHLRQLCLWTPRSHTSKLLPRQFLRNPRSNLSLYHWTPKIYRRSIHQKHFLRNSANVELIDEIMETNIEDTTIEERDLVTFRDTLVQDVLQEKAIKDLHFIHANQTVFEAIRSMNEKKIGALLVKDQNEKICGIITERDYLNKVALKGLRSWEISVDTIMTPNPRGVTPKASVMRCFTIMTHYRFRHLVVLSESDQAVIGLVSIGDLVKAVLEQYKETIFYLREYIEKRW